MNSIVLGSCIDGMNQMPAGVADLVFADPPFNIGYDYDVYEDAKEQNEYLKWSKEWISAVHRVLKPSGTFWLAIGDEYAAELKLICQEVGFVPRSWVIWYYTFGVNCSRKFSRSHAHLFHFTKDPENFTFHGDELENRIPSARQLVYSDRRANPKGRLPDDTWILRPQDLADRFTSREDMWYFPRVAGTFKERAGFHGCQMPEQLLGRIIRVCSTIGDLVLDPFAGSATTLVVAKKLGRKYLGFDISEEYVNRGIRRLERARTGDPLEGAPEPTMSAPATFTSEAPKNKKKGARDAQLLPQFESSVDQEANLVRKTADGIAAAFRNCHQGYSLERVLCDPELRKSFKEHCQSQGLVGDERSWNFMLLKLRKEGRLPGIAEQKRTEISWQDCDPYLFASEIALRQVLDLGYSDINELLCEPTILAQFDAIAQRFAPGYSLLHYRWAAVKLAEEMQLANIRAEVLAPPRLATSNEALPKAIETMPDSPGIYCLTELTTNECLYVGETLNLRQRLVATFATDSQKRLWSGINSDISVAIFVAEGEPGTLLAYQAKLVRSQSTRWNLAPK